MIDSKRMQAVQSPVIPHVAALIRDNPGTISLGQGVVHYPPPPQAMQAVAHFGGAIVEHHYQAARGLPELREELRQKLACENRIEVRRPDPDGHGRLQHGLLPRLARRCRPRR